MATSTTNLGLTKPAGTDKIRIAQINGNMDILDEKIGAVGNTSLQAQITSQNQAISNIASPTNYTNDILADALNVQGTKVFSGSGSVYTGTVPDNVYKYGVFTVYKRYSTYLVVAVGDNNHVAVNSYNTVWSGWQELALNSDLTNKIKKKTITVSCIESTWQSITLSTLSQYGISETKIINVIPAYGQGRWIVWRMSGGNIIFLRLNTSETNIVIDNTAGDFSLDIIYTDNIASSN